MSDDRMQELAGKQEMQGSLPALPDVREHMAHLYDPPSDPPSI